MVAERTRSRPLPGTQHFINPKRIPADEDFVALSGFGSLVRWLAVAAAIASMFLAVYLIFDGASGIGSGTVHRLFDLATNPVIGLLIGIVATATIQSSTTVTALTVAAVGTGSLQVAVALPIILGANVGTTLTSLIVSFGFVGSRARFQRAFSAASLHAAFNVVFVVIAFGLEMLFHPLRRLAELVSSSVLGDGPADTPTGDIILEAISPIIDTVGIRGWLGELLGPRGASVVAIALGALVIVVAVRVISRQLAVLTAATTRTLLERSSGASDALGLLSGALITMAVSASSVTVSSLLPFAATKSLRYREVLPVILGANVGTTLTALLTALAVPGSMGSIAVQAALIHVAFNVISALLVLLIPPLRALILWMGQVSGRVAARGYTLAAGVIAASYLILPLAVILGYTLVT